MSNREYAVAPTAGGLAGTRCVFCRGLGKMTDEHIWGQWTKNYVPRPTNKHDFNLIRVPRPQEAEEPVTRVRSGAPLNAKVKVVCSTCNSGWMSAIQDRAKPFLIPLFDGERNALDGRAQAAIATWIAMATMTGEYLVHNASEIAVPQADREWLMKAGTPPPGWRVWIGRYRRKTWPGQWVRASFPILAAEAIPAAVASNARSPTTQATTFVVGQLFAHAMSSVFGDVVGGWNWRTAPRAGSRLLQLWPSVSRHVFWPPPDMNDADAESFSTAFLRYSNDLAKRVGYH